MLVKRARGRPRPLHICCLFIHLYITIIHTICSRINFKLQSHPCECMVLTKHRRGCFESHIRSIMSANLLGIKRIIIRHYFVRVKHQKKKTNSTLKYGMFHIIYIYGFIRFVLLWLIYLSVDSCAVFTNDLLGCYIVCYTTFSQTRHDMPPLPIKRFSKAMVIPPF